MKTPNTIALRAAAIACAAAATGADIVHEPSYPLSEARESGQFGSSIDGVGDINNDGHDDFIVGSRFTNASGTNSAGHAIVFCGRTATPIFTFDGEADTDNFGFSVAGAGDVNDDGVPDLIVGAPLHNAAGLNDSGRATVFCGATGTVLYTINGEAADDRLGTSVAGAGDVNNDGHDDFIVGAPNHDTGPGGSNAGRVRVYSGATGAVLHTFDGPAPGLRIGQAIDGAGDVNNDDHDDIIIGIASLDTGGPDRGGAFVYCGATGALLHSFIGAADGDNLGHSVAGAGDVNNDAHDDVIVGAILDDTGDTNAGAAYVFCGATGAVLHTFADSLNPALFGWSVDGAGDLNNDGHADLVVGANIDQTGGTAAGRVFLYCGDTGALIDSFTGYAPQDRLGMVVRAAGDANGDGVADVLVAAPMANLYSQQEAGYIRVLASRVLPITPCPGDANTDGVVDFNDITTVLANWLTVCP